MSSGASALRAKLQLMLSIGIIVRRCWGSPLAWMWAALSVLSVPPSSYAALIIEDPAVEVVQWTSRLPQFQDEADALRSSLETQESIRVIVYLDLAVQPEKPSLGRAAIAKQRRAIFEAQTRLFRDLNIAPKEVRRQFKTIPAFVMNVDRKRLDQLIRQPDVTAIIKDTVTPLVLDGTAAIIEADLMHALGWTGLGQAVAILDTGVDRDHPMFLDSDGNSRVVAEACFSSNSSSSTSLCPDGTETQTGEGAGADCSGAQGCGHGTHVAGIAAGSVVTHSGVTFSGVAPEADIIAIQVFSEFTPSECGSSSSCVMSYTSDQVAALEWLLDQDESQGGPLQVASANMSLGGGRYSSHCDTATVAPAIRNLKNIGVATAIASGNSGYSDSISGPACISDAIAVGATTNSNLVAFYTSTSETLVDLYAPGSAVFSAANGGGYVSYSGTSMATPQVAGAWAVMKQAGVGDDTAAGVEAIETVLQQTGELISNREASGGSVDLGYSHPRIALKQALDRYDSQDDWLTVRLTGPGQGQVISSPAGIDCGPDCSMVVVPGDMIVLQATPAQGSELGGFEGCDKVADLQCTVDITGDRTVTVTFNVSPPDNDNFSDARVLVGSSISESFSTVGASFETGEPLPQCDSSGGSSVWFSWTLPEGELPSLVRVDTIGSEYDTILDVFSGSQLSALNSLGCDYGTFNANWTDSTVSFEATPGVTYWFRVSGYFGAEGSAKLNLTLSALTYGLQVVVDGAGKGTVTGSNLSCDSSNTPCSGTYTVEDMVTLLATPNATSDFDGWTGDCATFAADAECQLTMTGPRTATAFFKTKLPNDNLEFATTVELTPTTPFEAEVDLNLASTEMNEVVSSCGAIQSSVWFVWTAPAGVGSSPVTVDLSQSAPGFDPAVAVYTSSTAPPNFSSLTEVACLDQASEGSQSVLRLVDGQGVSIVQPNETYYIQLGRMGPMSGTAHIRVSFGNQLLSIEQTVIDLQAGQPEQVGGVEVITNGDFCFTQNCVQELATGQSVVLRAYTPTQGGTNPGGFETHGFVRWTGCDEAVGRQCTVTMDSDRTVVAEYEQANATVLEVQLSRLKGRVYSTDLGIDCNNTATLDDDRIDWQTCEAGYRVNETVQLTADSMTAAVVQWSENCVPDPLDAWACTVTMDTDELVMAEFIDASVLTTSILGIGEIRSATPDLGQQPGCAGSCVYYPTGDVVQLEAIPDPRYRFQQWTGACQGSDPICQFSLEEDRNVGAIFEIIPTIFESRFQSTSP